MTANKPERMLQVPSLFSSPDITWLDLFMLQWSMVVNAALSLRIHEAYSYSLNTLGSIEFWDRILGSSYYNFQLIIIFNCTGGIIIIVVVVIIIVLHHFVLFSFTSQGRRQSCKRNSIISSLFCWRPAYSCCQSTSREHR